MTLATEPDVTNVLVRRPSPSNTVAFGFSSISSATLPSSFTVAWKMAPVSLVQAPSAMTVVPSSLNWFAALGMSGGELMTWRLDVTGYVPSTRAVKSVVAPLAMILFSSSTFSVKSSPVDAAPFKS